MFLLLPKKSCLGLFLNRSPSSNALKSSTVETTEGSSPLVFDSPASASPTRLLQASKNKITNNNKRDHRIKQNQTESARINQKSIHGDFSISGRLNANIGPNLPDVRYRIFTRIEGGAKGQNIAHFEYTPEV